MNSRIIPLNLPARSAEEISGNPVTSRLDAAVGNCFPGLDLDARNLDRRFFPGLIFEFISNGTGDYSAPTGARLVGIDLSDPDLPLQDPDPRQALPKLLAQVTALAEALNGGKTVFLEALTVQGGQRIEFRYATGTPYDWDVSWRIVRSIGPRNVTIELGTRPDAESPLPMTLTAARRTFQQPSGELSTAYKAGELTQSLCSPWQHDFRDCGCTYWASNRPDIALPAYPATIEETQNAGPSADRAEDPVLWLRWDRSRETGPRATIDGCSPFEMDHYEINERWKELAFVVENRERGELYSPGPDAETKPLTAALKEELRRLAGIEQALALEYLYARYTVRFGESDLPVAEQGHADFIARELLVIAISEMTHLRWVNQLLRELHRQGHIDEFEPALDIGKVLPPDNRVAESRALTAAINGFVDAEAPSGTLDGQYARLRDFFKRQKYSPDLIGLLERIISDGVTHYSRFREIKGLLDRYPGRLVRTNINPLKPTDNEYSPATMLYLDLKRSLREAYADGGSLDKAHRLMREIDDQAKRLAGRDVGLPLVEIALACIGK